ncbi:hypothetical protein D3C86_2256700 [compost metagenome]
MQEVFRNGMVDFMENDRTKEAIAQAEKFSWEIAARQYMELYHECLVNSIQK